MSEHKVVSILDTGVSNIASVRAAMERAGATTRFIRTTEEIEESDFLIFPGVGSFGAGMRQLDETGVAPAIRRRFVEDRPTMAICLGLQLLFEESEESPGVAGLGVVSGKVERFPSTVRVPQFGWNSVVADESCRYLESGHAYFANSYAAMVLPEGWVAATAEHGRQFVAAMERGRWLACQFHPEISGPWGQALIERWLGGARGDDQC